MDDLMSEVMSEMQKTFKNAEPVTAVQPNKFFPGDPNARAFFQENGYAVFSNVAEAHQLESAVDLFWQHLEETSNGRISRSDLATWDDDNWPGVLEVGINSQNGIGQSGFQWFCRGIPEVKRAFATIWQDDNLLVSFDAAGAFRPAQYNPRWRTNAGWWHVDQNGRKRGLHATQGLLNIYPSGESDGGLALWPRSQKAFEKYWDHADTISEIDYSLLPKHHPIWQTEIQELGLSPVKLCMEPGDFVVWDSRTIHCNTPSHRSTTERPWRLDRLVSYICMTPAKLMHDPDVIEQRIQAHFRGITCNHWPHHYFPVTGEFRMNLPELNVHQRALLAGRTIADDEWEQLRTKYRFAETE
eukprot:TRINITY_DN158_c0_g1_i2.p1 TRINITY_DN158_c0_g1~~TRINITY_DN158_c0_g1_i2.p1  ORF type:complete len:356 (+),score=38.99 TRINITY_DN158_c0_g1_i2:115-1182(+)